MKTIKDQFDEAAKGLTIGYERRYAARVLADLQSTVKAFRDEGFNVALEVRPDKIGNTYFKESAGEKILFNGEVTTEGQRIDIAAIHATQNGNKMHFIMSWGGERQLLAVALYRDSAAGYVDAAVTVDSAPFPKSDVRPMDAAFREVLVHVLAKHAAAVQFNVAEGPPDKSFKVPSTIKLAKDKAP